MEEAPARQLQEIESELRVLEIELLNRGIAERQQLSILDTIEGQRAFIARCDQP